MTSSLLPDPSKYDLARRLQACQAHSRRNGKVARLPAALCNQINLMLDDGVPYKQIIASLCPAGAHLNEDNLSNWRLGGYQDYLKAQLLTDHARTQTEAAADLLRDTDRLDPVKLQQVCREMSLLQYLTTLMQHGEQFAHESIQRNPAKLITLMNACCNSANTNIALERRNWRLAAPPKPGCAGGPDEKSNARNAD